MTLGWDRGERDKTNTHALTECGVAVGELLGLNVFLQQMVCWKTGQGDCGRLAVSAWQTRTRREREKTYKEKQKRTPPKKQRKTITLTYRANTEGKRKFAPSWERLINPETDFMTFTLRKTLQWKWKLQSKSKPLRPHWKSESKFKW